MLTSWTEDFLFDVPPPTSEYGSIAMKTWTFPNRFRKVESNSRSEFGLPASKAKDGCGLINKAVTT